MKDYRQIEEDLSSLALETKLLKKSADRMRKKLRRKELSIDAYYKKKALRLLKKYEPTLDGIRKEMADCKEMIDDAKAEGIDIGVDTSKMGAIVDMIDNIKSKIDRSSV